MSTKTYTNPWAGLSSYQDPESADVQLKLADPARAGLILPAENEENEDVLMLLMPMLLND